MLNDELLDKVSERLINRIEQQNTYILEQIGKTIKEIGTLTLTQAHQLGQIMKYGGNYDKIIKKIAQITNINVKDIKKIFEEVAKSDYRFAKQFYDYRGVKYIPFEQNKVLKRKIDAISNVMVDEYLTKTKAIGFSVKDLEDNVTFKPLEKAYKEIIDKAILSVSQGKTTFNEEMYKVIKEYGSSGLKTFDYESGRSVRLDSAIRMNMKDTLRQLHNEEQELFGKEFNSDGVEISVHFNPAPDHALVQGKQFSNEEFNKFQNDKDCYSYDKIFFPAEFEGHDRRSISEYNCYHYTFAIILGVSEQAYTNEELKQIIDDNNKGFDYEGKHYTNYEGTQLQRDIEKKIREQKDIQIMARASGQDDLVTDSQKQISILTKKYKELSNVSGLPTKMDRMRVSGYKRINVSPKNNNISFNFEKYRNILDSTTDINDLRNNFDYQGFVNEYNKFYNSLDKKEIQEINSKYKEWFNTEMNTSNPMGEFLNKKFDYDELPELIEEKDFWIDEDGESVLRYKDTTSLDRKHWFRGVGYNSDADKVKKYTNEFKNGNYYAGIGINGNGTYATESFSYASSYGNDDNGGILYIMPKDDAKIISIDKISSIKFKFTKYINSNDEEYIDFTTRIFDDNGYLAELMGYDIVDLGDHKIILNRGAIKVVK